jgi:hypothetical protein
MLRALLLLFLLVPATGCYYALIDTGRPESVRTVQEGWAPAYVGGMIAPRFGTLVERCPHGAARVEAHRSFANLAVMVLTIGIYAPTTVEVTCALDRSKPTAPLRRG